LPDVAIASILAFEIKTSAAVTVQLYSDAPDPETLITQQSINTLGRIEMVQLVLPATARGRLWRLKVIPPVGVTLRIDGAKVWAKRLGKAAAEWAWRPIPMQITPETWGEAALPANETPDGWSEFALPANETPDGWSEFALPAVETPDGWGEIALPAPEAPDGYQWAELPMDE
jgi:hypothetical protein